jgi:hypothetical protein
MRRDVDLGVGRGRRSRFEECAVVAPPPAPAQTVASLADVEPESAALAMQRSLDLLDGNE